MEERVRIQEEFERGVTKVLICTDLMTRGIDVPGECVLHFNTCMSCCGALQLLPCRVSKW